MVQIPSPNHLLLPVKSSSLVAVGSNIYKIGGSDDIYGENFWKLNYASSVSVLDCRTHTWKQAPSMTMERNSASTSSVVDGKIYVAGGCKDKYVSYRNWIEVFDPKTKTWENVKNPRIFRLHEEYRNKGFIAKSFEIDGKLYMFGDDGAVYNPKEGVFKWYDLKVSLWKELKGVEGLPDFRDQKICKMVDLGWWKDGCFVGKV
ncbi:hypothetical protein AALP_AA7G274400 [Arabis alpina]|uniref:FKB95-like N-terminal Kelch domain-containing protein n=1 Tax=Arabis alpina TaxID=50452 RepID=A0A087GKX8_ARAAL|nr:hypothetical protein AALP_AA7G274400 [Arabis alpina]